MLKYTLQCANKMSKRQKRLMVLAQATSPSNGGRPSFTHQRAMGELRQLGQKKKNKATRQSPPPPHRVSLGARPSSSTSLGYDVVEPYTGDSILQQRFNELVRAALLRFGPPLPAEFVGDNKIVTSSSNKRDLGADGSSFEMVDEAKVKMYELYDILRKQKPDFSIETDCDGVPLSLMVKNCQYLRSYEGKVCYMRYLRKEKGEDGMERLVLSIGKYKMREYAPQDGIRQGPQPWLYSYKMI